MKRQRILQCLAIVLCFAATTAAGDSNDDHAAILKAAGDALNDDYKQSWSYVETTVESEQTTVGTYDPREAIGERWELVSVDGKPPSEDQVAKFLEEKANDSDESEDDDDGLDSIADPESLILIDETDSYWLYSFTPSPDDDDADFVKSLNATMKIIKDGPYISIIDMSSEQPFKPQFGVKIKEFSTTMRFGPAAVGGPIVPLSMDVLIKGRAFLAVGINETINISFTDYQFVGD